MRVNPGLGHGEAWKTVSSAKLTRYGMSTKRYLWPHMRGRGRYPEGYEAPFSCCLRCDDLRGFLELSWTVELLHQDSSNSTTNNN